MRELRNKLRKRRVWGIGAFVFFMLLFLSFFALKDSGIIKAAPGDDDQEDGYQFMVPSGNLVSSGGNYVMTQRTGRFQLVGGMVGDSNVTFDWSSTNPEVFDFVPGTVSADSAAVYVQVGNVAGDAGISVTITKKDANGNVVAQQTALLQMRVAFRISEDFPGPGYGSVYMNKVYESDERKSLIMNYGSSVEVGNAEAASGILKPVFGDLASTNATLISSNEDVIKYDSATHRLQATGAGPASLMVSYVIGTETFTDTINVYVKPQLTVQDADNPGQDVIVGGSNSEVGTVSVENGDKIGISILDVARPELAIGDKIVWVISKGEGEEAALVRDSLGNTGEDADEATLEYIKSEKAYRVNAKAGVYNIQFYVKGSYTNFEDSKTNPAGIGSINLQTKVKCSFVDKKITLNLGSSYSLADALNMPLDMLKTYFDSLPDPMPGYEDKFSWDSNNLIITAQGLGTAYIKIKPKANISIGDIPGLTSLDEITVTVTVVDTFSLNISATTLAVGSSLELYGIIGSNTFAEEAQFQWTVSDEKYVTLSNDIGRIVTVTAKQQTEKDDPVIVSLAWTDNDSVTWVATCSLTITSSATDFKITPETKRLEVGGTDYLQTNLTGTQNILWLSSDTSIVTVEPQTGNVGAKITATDKPGEVVITAINRDNDTYATAIVTVTAAITDIKIDKGETFTTTIATPYVFMEAVYQPSNATSTEMVWTSSDESVATVNENGMVTVKKIGQTTISVKPSYNPNGVFAQCVLTVKEDPITAIKTDVTTLNMMKGDMYEVKVTLTPENPTDRTLTWTSSKTSVATVTNGKITAVGVGTATIMVQGGNATPVMIEVNVRERLTNIAFENTSMELSVKETKKLEVIFTPNEGVNKNVTFYSSDESIVTVDKDGNVTGISVGKAMITCIAEDLGEYRPITCNITVTQEVILPTEFTIDPTEQTIRVGDDFTILPIFTPADTTNQEVRYESLDDDVATVTEEGVVTGVKAGQTVIQCTAVESNLTALCKVTVENAITFSLNPSSREIAIGKSFTITKVTKPSNVDKAAIWQTSNSKIASITASGKVTGKKIGSCTITCTLKKYNQSATCRVKVAKLRSTLKLDKTSIRMNVGSTYRLKKTVWSNNSTTPTVKFSSKNSRIATVGSSSGKITAKRVGSTVITAKTTDAVHATAKCRVTVIRRATSVSLNKTYAVCHIGSTIKLKATVKPTNASIKKVKWTSSNPNIASVTASGKITGYAEGDVYITATTTDGSNKSAKCFVKVMEPIPATNIMVAQQKLTMKKGNTTQLSYTILPDNQTDTIKMASDNKNVATVSNTGKVKAVGTGVATITITSSSGITATVEVNVVALNKTSLRIRQYDAETLLVVGTSDAVTWYSANNRIATVTNGRVVGRGIGTTYIYAYVNGCKMGCKVQIVSVNSK